MKLRIGPDGVHAFDRKTGLNILFDEARADERLWSKAPRQISIALTNLCDLQCSYCYAPKQRAALNASLVATWLEELDKAGCLGIGFGGGEPTLHPEFSQICQHAKEKTRLAVTFTTHGHRLRPQLLKEIAGHVNFIRVSVDGVGSTYEKLRNRPYEDLLENLRRAREITPIGINVVVNDETFKDLDELTELAERIDASEILLLPQQRTYRVSAASPALLSQLDSWIRRKSAGIRLAVSVAGATGLPTCDPLPNETGLRSYAHIDAVGRIKESSYGIGGIPISNSGVLHALRKLKDFTETQA